MIGSFSYPEIHQTKINKSERQREREGDDRNLIMNERRKSSEKEIERQLWIYLWGSKATICEPSTKVFVGKLSSCFPVWIHHWFNRIIRKIHLTTKFSIQPGMCSVIQGRNIFREVHRLEEHSTKCLGALFLEEILNNFDSMNRGLVEKKKRIAVSISFNFWKEDLLKPSLNMACFDSWKRSHFEKGKKKEQDLSCPSCFVCVVWVSEARPPILKQSIREAHPSWMERSLLEHEQEELFLWTRDHTGELNLIRTFFRQRRKCFWYCIFVFLLEILKGHRCDGFLLDQSWVCTFESSCLLFPFRGCNCSPMDHEFKYEKKEVKIKWKQTVLLSRSSLCTEINLARSMCWWYRLCLITVGTKLLSTNEPDSFLGLPGDAKGRRESIDPWYRLIQFRTVDFAIPNLFPIFWKDVFFPRFFLWR